jgi:hypothetical protein
VVEVATPAAFVIALVLPPAKVPPAPLAGGVNVTVTPETGLLFASLTVAESGDGKGVAIFVVCGVPPVALIEAGDCWLIVSAKVAVAL